MWVQAHVKQFFEAVVDRLDAIEKAVQEHTSATHEAKEASSEEWRQIPGIVSHIIDSKNKAEAERTKRAEVERKKEQNPLVDSQERIAKWTKRACIAAIGYGAVAFWQGCLTRETYREIREQTAINSAMLTETRNALDTSQSNFDRTMRQIIPQTIAQSAAKAARDASRIAKNALEEQTIEFESQNPPAQISIDPYISWYYQSPKNSPPCKMGFVCALLFIHNIVPNSVATGVEVAAKIAILPFAPKVNPQNWRSIGPPTTIRYSAQTTSGTYPYCLEWGCFKLPKL